MATLWSFACVAGVWGFVLCTIGFVLKGFPARGVFDARSSLGWGGAAAACFLLWMVAMSRA